MNGWPPRDVLIEESVRRIHAVPDLRGLEERVTALARSRSADLSIGVPQEKGRSVRRWLLPAAVVLVSALTMCASRFSPQDQLRAEGEQVQRAALASSFAEAMVIAGAAALASRGELRRSRRARVVRHRTGRDRRGRRPIRSRGSR